MYTWCRLLCYMLLKKKKVLRGKSNIDLVLTLENFPLEIDNICADTKNKIFKRWGHVGSQAILEIILKMFPLAQNVHQSLVICHYWCSRLLVKMNWLKHGSSERQFPGGENAHPSIILSYFFFFFFWCQIVIKCFQSLLSVFHSVSVPKIYFLLCMLIDFLDLWSQGTSCQCAIHS